MTSYFSKALWLVMCTAPWFVNGQEPPVEPKIEIELRWVENRHVENLTEEVGFQTSCDPKDIVYAHKKPALRLTSAEVTETRITEHDFSKSGSGVQYMVAIHLTEGARNQLAATVQDKEMRLFTIVVDGKYWGVQRYEKDPEKEFVPAACRSETLTPSVGFFSSRGEAQRLTNALNQSTEIGLDVSSDDTERGDARSRR